MRLTALLTTLTYLTFTLCPPHIFAFLPSAGALTTTSTSTVSPGQSYWVNVSAASTWSPPLPRNVTTSYVYDGKIGDGS